MSDPSSISYAPQSFGADAAIVDSLSHPLAMAIRRLLDPSEKKNLQQIIIDDEENILQALDAGVALLGLFYAGGVELSAVLQGRIGSGVAIHEVAKRTCKKLFENEKISRVFAIAEKPAAVPLQALGPLDRDIVVLEEIGISGNVGAIVRTALALGTAGIVLLNKSPADIYDRRLIRASRGYIFSLPIVTAATGELVEFCRRWELPLVVTAPQADLLVDGISSIPKRLALVFGGERNGCSQAILEAATTRIRIPTTDQVQSLNVSAAAGITLYCRRQFNRVGTDSR
jgi:TrmH family RNA methyltransferase